MRCTSLLASFAAVASAQVVVSEYSDGQAQVPIPTLYTGATTLHVSETFTLTAVIPGSAQAPSAPAVSSTPTTAVSGSAVPAASSTGDTTTVAAASSGHSTTGQGPAPIPTILSTDVITASPVPTIPSTGVVTASAVGSTTVNPASSSTGGVETSHTPTESSSASSSTAISNDATWSLRPAASFSFVGMLLALLA